MTDPSWQRYRAADRRLQEEINRLLQSDYQRTLHDSLTGGRDFHAAIELLLHHVPDGYVADHLDVILPLAIEGGLEQADVRRRLRGIDRTALASALPELVGRVLHGTGDQYLEYVGLLDLLAGLGERRLFHAVLVAARSSTDPEIREAAEPYEGEQVDPAAVAPPPEHPTRKPRPPVAPPAEWREYVAAWREYRQALGSLEQAPREEFLPTALRDPAQRDVALHYLAIVVARGGYQGADVLVRRVLDALPPGPRDEVLAALAGGFLQNPHLRRVEGYRSLLWLLGEAASDETFRLALERGRACPDPEIRIVAETTPAR
ncbi:hypothetical protein ACNAW0_13675 [Micromonospora sp. SL1-18]|uniref:hypothetical protein n=1 Tax=Micromonospora sp. SL1-18 TaxID=3399128 RepID=UPI003A4D84A5